MMRRSLIIITVMQNSEFNIGISVYYYYLSGFVMISEKSKKEETIISLCQY